MRSVIYQAITCLILVLELANQEATCGCEVPTNYYSLAIDFSICAKKKKKKKVPTNLYMGIL